MTPKVAFAKLVQDTGGLKSVIELEDFERNLSDYIGAISFQANNTMTLAQFEQFVTFLKQEKRIDAIKHLRAVFGLGLKEAKDLVMDVVDPRHPTVEDSF